MTGSAHDHRTATQRILQAADYLFYNEGIHRVAIDRIIAMRRKIDRPFAVKQLETVRGAGYRLAAQPCAAVPTQSEHDADG
jgi:DNA-binding response OmpR family regulator